MRYLLLYKRKELMYYIDMSISQWKKNIINRLNSAELIKFLREASEWEAFVIAVDSKAFNMEIVTCFYLNSTDGMVMNSLRKTLSKENYNRIQDKIQLIIQRTKKRD